jgi:hypothetical protein
MRRLFTSEEARRSGLSRGAVRWRERAGLLRRVARGVWAEGPEEPTPFDVARARLLAAKGVARGRLAGVLHQLDGVTLDGTTRHRRSPLLGEVVEIAGVPCAGGFQTMVDLAADLDDLRWEQALESALRKRLTTIDDLECAVTGLGRARIAGTARVRRVLGVRPSGAAPTDSLLETLTVQLARRVGLADPVRQFVVNDADGSFVARVDLCWPVPGLFIELDGQQHEGQPIYDARRETAVVAATGWLPGRFTWHEVVRVPRTTGRRLAAVMDQASRRSLEA